MLVTMLAAAYVQCFIDTYKLIKVAKLCSSHAVPCSYICTSAFSPFKWIQDFTQI